MENNKSNLVKIPVLSEKELIELGKIIHNQRENELAERIFWIDIYKERGLEYKKGGASE